MSFQNFLYEFQLHFDEYMLLAVLAFIALAIQLPRLYREFRKMSQGARKLFLGDIEPGQSIYLYPPEEKDSEEDKTDKTT